MYDVIVIGSGPAGVTASIYIKRAGFNVLIISNNKSSLQKSDKIENYYGFEKPIYGLELQKKGINQAKNLGIEMLKKEVIGIKYSNLEENKYEIIIANQGKDEIYQAKFIVIATGINRNKPNIEGVKEFEGKGVSYCAICDASLYRNKDVAVIGNGNYALGEIEELIPIANNIIMLTDGEEPIENRTEIKIDQRKIKKIKGNLKIEEIEFEDGSSQKIQGVFIAQGIASSIDFAKKIGAKIEKNNIVVNENMETTVKNIYACGDCTGGILQISKAVYEGTKVGLEIIKKLRKGELYE